MDSSRAAQRREIEPLVTPQEAAQRLNLALWAIREAIALGRLSVVRISRRCVRIRPEDLAQYAQARAHGGAAGGGSEST